MLLRCKIGSSYFYSETMKYQNIKHLLRKWIGKSPLFHSAQCCPNHSAAGAMFSAYLGARSKAVHQMSSFSISFSKTRQNNPRKSRSGCRNLFHNCLYQPVHRPTRGAAPVTSFSAEISQEKCKSDQHVFAFHLSLSSGNKIQIISGATERTF